jgi:hypothetical protein
MGDDWMRAWHPKTREELFPEITIKGYSADKSVFQTSVLWADTVELHCRFEKNSGDYSGIKNEEYDFFWSDITTIRSDEIDSMWLIRCPGETIRIPDSNLEIDKHLIFAIQKVLFLLNRLRPEYELTEPETIKNMYHIISEYWKEEVDNND